MLKAKKATSINDSAGFRRMFAPDWLSLGVFFPIEAFERDEPSMRDGAMMGTADLVPKPVSRLPILITGSSRQSFEWIAEHASKGAGLQAAGRCAAWPSQAGRAATAFRAYVTGFDFSASAGGP